MVSVGEGSSKGAAVRMKAMGTGLRRKGDQREAGIPQLGPWVF